jgi:hypothetical protein
MKSEKFQPTFKLIITMGDHASLARSDVFDRMKGKNRYLSPSSHVDAFIISANSVRRILDDE